MPLADAAIAAIAARLIAARLGGNRIAVPNFRLDDEADVARIQDAVVRGIGRVGGWKTGPAGPDGVPNSAPIFSADILDAGAGPVTFARGRPVGVELEVCYRLGPGFVAAEKAPSRAEVAAAVTSAHVALEICDSRFLDRESTPPIWRRADGAVNEGLIVGPRIADAGAIPWKSLRARLIVDGVTVVDKVAGLGIADGLDVLTAFVGRVVTHRGGLAPGMVVTTGSWTGMQFYPPGSRLEGVLEGAGRIEAVLA